MTARHYRVTGGAGFIEPGRARVHLTEALLARGDTVTVTDDLSTGRMANIEHLVANLHSDAGAQFGFAIDTIRKQ